MAQNPLKFTAVAEVNAEMRDKSISEFKYQVKNLIKLISDNNLEIQFLQETNDRIRREISELEIKDTEDYILDEI